MFRGKHNGVSTGIQFLYFDQYFICRSIIKDVTYSSIDASTNREKFTFLIYIHVKTYIFSRINLHLLIGETLLYVRWEFWYIRNTACCDSRLFVRRIITYYNLHLRSNRIPVTIAYTVRHIFDI